MLFPVKRKILKPNNRVITNKPNTTADAFTFSTDGLTGQDVAYEAGNINVWPNPYFGYNPEERNPLDQKVQFTHLPDDGSQTKIRIFDLAGQPVRTIVHDGSSQFVHWDLKNNYNVPVASGMYLAYVETDSGSKTLKLGVLQPEQRIDVY